MTSTLLTSRSFWTISHGYPELCTALYAPRDALYWATMLIGCVLVPAIQWYGQFPSSGRGDLVDSFNGIQFLPLDKNTYLRVQCFVNLTESEFPAIKYSAFVRSCDTDFGTLAGRFFFCVFFWGVGVLLLALVFCVCDAPSAVMALSVFPCDPCDPSDPASGVLPLPAPANGMARSGLPRPSRLLSLRFRKCY